MAKSDAVGAMNVAITAWEGGSAFMIKAHPGAKRRRIAGIHGGALKVDIEAAPEKGKANAALRSYLASLLELSSSKVYILSGETATLKRIGVKGIGPSELLARVNGLVVEKE